MPSKNDSRPEKAIDSFLMGKVINKPDTLFRVAAAIVIAFLMGAFWFGLAFGHDGQLSPKDGCHKQDGKRHWHKKGSKIGGRCYTKGGHRYREKVIKQVIIKKPEIPTCEKLKHDFLRASGHFVTRQKAVGIARDAIEGGCWK